MSTVKNYLSLIKFSHTIFAMPFALIGFFLGIKQLVIIPSSTIDQLPELQLWDKTSLYFSTNGHIFLLVILCMVFARSAAMAFNRFLDRRFDAKNPRTAIREVPSGIITPKNALMFTIINCILFFAATYFINPICFYLSPVALFVILFYSYTKRFTWLCHLVLGLGLSLAPIGAYLAVTGKFHLLPILFSFAVLFWVSGFDIIYSLQDEAFDRDNDLYSMPSSFGKAKALNISSVLHLFSAACVVAAGILGHFGLLYWVGVVVFISMLLYQHSLVKPHDLSRVDLAFMTANGIASVVFAVFVIADFYLAI